MPKLTAILYIDGFNLYRRCLQGRPEVKWLDLRAFAHALLPAFDVVKIHYFTAKVKPGASPERNAHQRQDTYLRAVRTLSPDVEIHMGTFRIDTRVMTKHPVEVDPVTGQYARVKVRKIEEKGSDVNLAARMVADAFTGRADYYVMLSNDSDQVGTLTIMKNEVGARTGIVLPMESAKGSKALMATGPDFVGHVTRGSCWLPSSWIPSPTNTGRSTGRRHGPEKSEGPRDARAF